MNILLLFLIFEQVLSHGFMIGLIDCDTKELVGKVRGYSDITFNIDSLRNPLEVFCRGMLEVTPIQIKKSKNVCVSLAISNGAAHTGPCNLRYINKVTGTETLSLIKNECLNTQDISRDSIPGLTTGDMTRYDTKFKLPCFNSELGSFIIKWEWEARHVTPFEYYNNCIDVVIV